MPNKQVKCPMCNETMSTENVILHCLAKHPDGLDTVVAALREAKAEPLASIVDSLSMVMKVAGSAAALVPQPVRRPAPPEYHEFVGASVVPGNLRAATVEGPPRDYNLGNLLDLARLLASGHYPTPWDKWRVRVRADEVLVQWLPPDGPIAPGGEPKEGSY